MRLIDILFQFVMNTTSKCKIFYLFQTFGLSFFPYTIKTLVFSNRFFSVKVGRNFFFMVFFQAIFFRIKYINPYRAILWWATVYAQVLTQGKNCEMLIASVLRLARAVFKIDFALLPTHITSLLHLGSR
jgi:hypothetical protein